MSADSANNLLTAAYTAEVMYRHNQMIMDDATKQHIREVAEILVTDSAKLGIVICGTCGNGKTTMLYALSSAIIYLKRSNLTNLATFLPEMQIVDAHDLAKVARSDSAAFSELHNSKMLAIEDMGKEAAEVQSYGNVISPVAEVIERRYDKQLFTVITTNLPPPEISKKYGVRVGDRLREMMTIIDFSNETYRK